MSDSYYSGSSSYSDEGSYVESRSGSSGGDAADDASYTGSGSDSRSNESGERRRRLRQRQQQSESGSEGSHEGGDNDDKASLSHGVGSESDGGSWSSGRSFEGSYVSDGGGVMSSDGSTQASGAGSSRSSGHRSRSSGSHSSRSANSRRAISQQRHHQSDIGKQEGSYEASSDRDDASLSYVGGGSGSDDGSGSGRSFEGSFVSDGGGVMSSDGSTPASGAGSSRSHSSRSRSSRSRSSRSHSGQSRSSRSHSNLGSSGSFRSESFDDHFSVNGSSFRQEEQPSASGDSFEVLQVAKKPFSGRMNNVSVTNREVGNHLSKDAFIVAAPTPAATATVAVGDPSRKEQGIIDADPILASFKVVPTTVVTTSAKVDYDASNETGLDDDGSSSWSNDSIKASSTQGDTGDFKSDNFRVQIFSDDSSAFTNNIEHNNNNNNNNHSCDESSNAEAWLSSVNASSTDDDAAAWSAANASSTDDDNELLVEETSESNNNTDVLSLSHHSSERSFSGHSFGSAGSGVDGSDAELSAAENGGGAIIIQESPSRTIEKLNFEPDVGVFSSGSTHSYLEGYSGSTGQRSDVGNAEDDNNFLSESGGDLSYGYNSGSAGRLGFDDEHDVDRSALSQSGGGSCDEAKKDDRQGSEAGAEDKFFQSGGSSQSSSGDGSIIQQPVDERHESSAVGSVASQDSFFSGTSGFSGSASQRSDTGSESGSVSGRDASVHDNTDGSNEQSSVADNAGEDEYLSGSAHSFLDGYSGSTGQHSVIEGQESRDTFITVGDQSGCQQLSEDSYMDERLTFAIEQADEGNFAQNQHTSSEDSDTSQSVPDDDSNLVQHRQHSETDFSPSESQQTIAQHDGDESETQENSEKADESYDFDRIMKGGELNGMIVMDDDTSCGSESGEILTKVCHEMKSGEVVALGDGGEVVPSVAHLDNSSNDDDTVDDFDKIMLETQAIVGNEGGGFSFDMDAVHDSGTNKDQEEEDLSGSAHSFLEGYSGSTGQRSVIDGGDSQDSFVNADDISRSHHSDCADSRSGSERSFPGERTTRAASTDSESFYDEGSFSDSQPSTTEEKGKTRQYQDTSESDTSANDSEADSNDESSAGDSSQSSAHVEDGISLSSTSIDEPIGNITEETKIVKRREDGSPFSSQSRAGETSDHSTDTAESEARAAGVVESPPRLSGAVRNHDEGGSQLIQENDAPHMSQQPQTTRDDESHGQRGYYDDQEEDLSGSDHSYMEGYSGSTGQRSVIDGSDASSQGTFVNEEDLSGSQHVETTEDGDRSGSESGRSVPHNKSANQQVEVSNACRAENPMRAANAQEEGEFSGSDHSYMEGYSGSTGQRSVIDGSDASSQGTFVNEEDLSGSQLSNSAGEDKVVFDFQLDDNIAVKGKPPQQNQCDGWVNTNDSHSSDGSTVHDASQVDSSSNDSVEVEDDGQTVKSSTSETSHEPQSRNFTRLAMAIALVQKCEEDKVVSCERIESRSTTASHDDNEGSTTGTSEKSEVIAHNALVTSDDDWLRSADAALAALQQKVADSPESNAAESSDAEGPMTADNNSPTKKDEAWLRSADAALATLQQKQPQLSGGSELLRSTDAALEALQQSELSSDCSGDDTTDYSLLSNSDVIEMSVDVNVDDDWLRSADSALEALQKKLGVAGEESVAQEETLASNEDPDWLQSAVSAMAAKKLQQATSQDTSASEEEQENLNESRDRASRETAAKIDDDWLGSADAALAAIQKKHAQSRKEMETTGDNGGGEDGGDDDDWQRAVVEAAEQRWSRAPATQERANGEESFEDVEKAEQTCASQKISKDRLRELMRDLVGSDVGPEEGGEDGQRSECSPDSENDLWDLEDEASQQENAGGLGFLGESNDDADDDDSDGMKSILDDESTMNMIEEDEESLSSEEASGDPSASQSNHSYFEAPKAGGGMHDRVPLNISAAAAKDSQDQVNDDNDFASTVKSDQKADHLETDSDESSESTEVVWAPASKSVTQAVMRPVDSLTIPEFKKAKTDENADIETGLPPKARPVKRNRAASDDSASLDSFDTATIDNDSVRKRPRWFFPLLIAVACLLITIIIFVVPWLLSDDESSEAEVTPPTPFIPTVPPASPVPTPTPLVPETAPPTDLLLPWILRDTVIGETGTGFGTTVAIDANIVLVGAPETDMVTPYFTTPGTIGWEEGEGLSSEQLGTLFGASIDAVNQRMVIGAPSTHADGTTIPTGASFFYVYSSLVKKWQPIGSALRGDEDITFASGEQFGSSGAVSAAFRVAVGAPKSSVAAEGAGRVYTFEYRPQSENGWESLEAFPLLGESASDQFGASVAMTSDGTRLLGGAPGSGRTSSEGNGSGYASMYQWIGTDWQLLFTLRGRDENEAFGSSVAFLSELGDIVAIGGPGHQRGSGRIVVYQQQPLSTEYKQLGPEIIGEPGESLGLPGCLSGSIGANGPTVIASTANGEVKRLDYDLETDSWNEEYQVIASTPFTINTVAFSANDSTDMLVVGSAASDKASIYETEEVVTSAPTRSVFTPRPSASTATASPVITPTTVPPLLPTKSPTGQTLVPTDPTSTHKPSAGLLTARPTAAPTALKTESPTLVATLPALTRPPTKAPTMAPTLSPTESPTDRPTTSPTAAQSLATWIRSGGPYRLQAGFGFGSAVAFSNSQMASGAPGALDVGVVLMFSQVNGIWSSQQSQQIVGTETGGEFGAAVDLAGDDMVIGAPNTFADNTETPTGAVYCYINKQGWIQHGGPLRGSDGLFGAWEQFGASVAVSKNQRVVVGAPGSSVDLLTERGRVYMFEYNSEVGEWTPHADILGKTSGESFGSAVDISASGNFAIVGAPGNGQGFATIYQHNPFSWFAITTIAGEEASEQMGSSVNVISGDGTVVAAGAPGYQNGRGRVVVYERNGSTGRFAQLGPSIVGELGERIGAPNTVTGSGSQPVVIVGTTTGLVKRFDFDRSSSAWVQLFATVDSGFRRSTGLLALSSPEDSNAFVAGGDDTATIYELG